MTGPFYVIGGEHTSTEFKAVNPGTEEQHGPFDTYDEALRKWRERTGWTIDNAYYRFFIVPAATLASKVG
jgi:hypothetical protein